MKNKKGFTLIELLAVIVILGILVSLSTIAITNISKKQEIKNRINVISSILTGAKSYFAEHPNEVEVSVKVLLSGDYVDFDTNKYPADGVTVAINYQESLGKQEVYIVKGNKKINEYNFSDCGLEAQSKKNFNSTELCKAYLYDGTNPEDFTCFGSKENNVCNGWDSEGKFYTKKINADKLEHNGVYDLK